jgi:hypothetical protein
MRYIRENERYKVVKCSDLGYIKKLPKLRGIIKFSFPDLISAHSIYYKLLKRRSLSSLLVESNRFNFLGIYYIESDTENSTVRIKQKLFLKDIKISRIKDYSESEIRSFNDPDFRYELLISLPDPDKFISIVGDVIDILNEEKFYAVNRVNNDVNLHTMSFSYNGYDKEYLIKTEDIIVV